MNDNASEKSLVARRNQVLADLFALEDSYTIFDERDRFRLEQVEAFVDELIALIPQGGLVND